MHVSADMGLLMLLPSAGGVYHWHPNHPANFRQLLPSSLHGGTCESLTLDPETLMLAASFRSSSNSSTGLSIPAAHWLYKLGWEEGEEPQEGEQEQQQQGPGQAGSSEAVMPRYGQQGVLECTPMRQQQPMQQWQSGQSVGASGGGGAGMVASSVLGLFTRSPVVSWDQQQQQQQQSQRQVLPSPGGAVTGSSNVAWQGQQQGQVQHMHMQQQQQWQQTPTQQQQMPAQQQQQQWQQAPTQQQQQQTPTQAQQRQQEMSEKMLALKNTQQLRWHASSQVMTTGCFLSSGVADAGPWFVAGDEASCCPWVWDCGDNAGRGRVLQQLQGLGVKKPLLAVSGELVGSERGAFGLLGALSEESLIVYEWVDAARYGNHE